MAHVDRPAVTEDRCPLQDVAQLSHVAGPLVLEKRGSCLARQFSGSSSEGPADLLQKAVAQRHDVRGTIAQRRNLDVEDAEAVEQVLAKGAALHRFPQVAVGRGDHPDVRLDEPRAAEALELAFLKHAQELRLRGEAHLGHLVEEQHAARRQFDLAGLCLVRAREGAALVAKQLGLEQLLGQRGAIQRDERPGPARRRGMDEPRDDFLAGARCRR